VSHNFAYSIDTQLSERPNAPYLPCGRVLVACGDGFVPGPAREAGESYHGFKMKSTNYIDSAFAIPR